MGKEKEWENLDAKGCPYPCRLCDLGRPERCTHKSCLKWKRWVGIKWKEVTEPLKRREENER